MKQCPVQSVTNNGKGFTITQDCARSLTFPRLATGPGDRVPFAVFRAGQSVTTAYFTFDPGASSSDGVATGEVLWPPQTSASYASRLILLEGDAVGILDDNVPEESKCVNVTFAPHHGASATMTLPHASYQCPGYWEQANAKFDVKQVGTQVTLTRTDGSQGWPALTIQLKCCDTGCVTIEVDFTSGSSSVTTPSYAALQPDGWRQYRMRLTVPPTKRSQHSRARTHAPLARRY